MDNEKMSLDQNLHIYNQLNSDGQYANSIPVVQNSNS